MAYGDDDDDRYDGDQVSGPGQLAGGFTRWPSLRQTPEHWSHTLKRDQSKPTVPKLPSNIEGQDEIRWGDQRTRHIIVPATTTGLIGRTPSFDQVVQLRRPARVWSLLYSVEFTNPQQTELLADETIIAFFSVYLGVGSSRIRIARDITITGPLSPLTPPIFPEFGIEASLTDPNLAAAEVVISVNAAVNVPTGDPVNNRTFSLILRAQAAPVLR